MDVLFLFVIIESINAEKLILNKKNNIKSAFDYKK